MASPVNFPRVLASKVRTVWQKCNLNTMKALQRLVKHIMISLHSFPHTLRACLVDSVSGRLIILLKRRCKTSCFSKPPQGLLGRIHVSYIVLIFVAVPFLLIPFTIIWACMEACRRNKPLTLYQSASLLSVLPSNDNERSAKNSRSHSNQTIYHWSKILRGFSVVSNKIFPPFWEISGKNMLSSLRIT